MNRIGIICALYFEASCVTPVKPVAQQPVEINEQTLLIVSGIGRHNAKLAAQKLIEEDVSCLVSFGCAGALSPELKPGDLILPEEVLSMEKYRLPVSDNTGNPETLPEEVHSAGKSYKVDAGLHAAIKQRLSQKNVSIHTGTLVSADKTLATVSAKQELYEQTGAAAVDMETAGILDAAECSGLPAIALRVITDPADQAIPETVLRRVNDFGETNVLGLAIDLVTSPGKIPTILHLGMANARAVKIMKLAAGELLNSDLSKWSN